MIRINVTEFRSHLPEYLGKVTSGEEVALTSRGKIVARLVPEADASELAHLRLAELRKSCKVGDVVSPIDASWEAIHDSD